MNEHQFFDALGDGWLGKLITGILAALGAWYLRRPAEQAAVLSAVDGRVKTAFDALERRAVSAESRCDRLEASLTADRARCDRELAELHAKIDEMMNGPVPGYTK